MRTIGKHKPATKKVQRKLLKPKVAATPPAKLAGAPWQARAADPAPDIADRPRLVPINASNRLDWEIALASDLETLSQMLVHYAEPLIPVFARRIEIPLAGVPLTTQVTLQVNAPRLRIVRDRLQLTFPIAEGSVSLPGYQVSYNGTSIRVEASLDSLMIEVRWLTPTLVQLVLHLNKEAITPAIELVNAPAEDVLAGCFKVGSKVVTEVLNRLPLEGMLLREIVLDETQVTLLKQFPALAPSRISPSFICQDGRELLVLRILCGGAFSSQKLDLQFNSGEGLLLVATNELLLRGCLIPTLLPILRVFSAGTPDNYLVQEGTSLGWKVPEKPILFDKAGDILQRSFVAENPKLKEAFKAVDKNQSLIRSIKILPSFSVADRTISVGAENYIDLHKWTIGRGISVPINTDWKLSISPDGKKVSVAPVMLSLDFRNEDKSSLVEDVLNVALFLVLFAVFPAIIAAVSILLFFILRPFFNGRSPLELDRLTGVGDLIRKVTDFFKLRAKFKEMREFIEYTRNNSNDIPGILNKLASSNLVPENQKQKLTLEALTKTFDIPELRLHRIASHADLRLYASFAPDTPPRPRPAPALSVAVYEYSRTAYFTSPPTHTYLYTTAAEPPSTDWRRERVAFRAFPVFAPKTVPVYCFRAPIIDHRDCDHHHHVLSTEMDPKKLTVWAGPLNWTLVGIAFYAFIEATPTTEEIRWFRPPKSAQQPPFRFSGPQWDDNKWQAQAVMFHVPKA